MIYHRILLILALCIVNIGAYSDTNSVSIADQSIGMPKDKCMDLDWIIGRSFFVHILVRDGRIRIEDLPPPDDEEALKEKFNDVVIGSQRGISIRQIPTENDYSYHSLSGELRTKQDYDAYVAKSRPNQSRFKSSA